MNRKWLEEYLAKAISKDLCTKIHCTTCGAMDFRRGVLSALSETIGNPPRKHFDRDIKITIAKAIAELELNDNVSAPFEGAVRCLLFDLWSGIPLLDDEIEALLAGTWAGEVLNKMKAHHENLETERRAREAFQEPENVQRRREEKKRAKQEQHETRLTLKKERDRIWRAGRAV